MLRNGKVVAAESVLVKEPQLNTGCSNFIYFLVLHVNIII